MLTLLHDVSLCTWNGHCEQHCVHLHPHIRVEGTAVETTVVRHHTCQVQADVQAVGTAHASPFAVVLAQQAHLHLLAHTDDAPGLGVRHPLHNDLKNGAIVLAVTADGQVIVLLCHQLYVCDRHLRDHRVRGLWDVFF